jgi:hypothetical protein
MLGPALELGGYLAFAVTVATGAASAPYILAFVCLAVVLGIALSISAVGLEEIAFRRYPRKRDLLHLFWLAVAENFGYRQLSTYWRIQGMVSKLRRITNWGEMERRGFTHGSAGTKGSAA